MSRAVLGVGEKSRCESDMGAAARWRPEGGIAARRAVGAVFMGCFHGDRHSGRVRLQEACPSVRIQSLSPHSRRRTPAMARGPTAETTTVPDNHGDRHLAGIGRRPGGRLDFALHPAFIRRPDPSRRWGSFQGDRHSGRVRLQEACPSIRIPEAFEPPGGQGRSDLSGGPFRGRGAAQGAGAANARNARRSPCKHPRPDDLVRVLSRPR